MTAAEESVPGRLEPVVARDALAWLLVAGGGLWLAVLLGAGGAPPEPLDPYLASVLKRSLVDTYQAGLLAGLIAVPLHALWTFGRRGRAAAAAYDQFGLWAQILFTSFGFMGTIVGVSLAVAGLEAAMQDGDPGALIGGLSTAFDTTFLGLAAAILLLLLRKSARLVTRAPA